jgi:hypothetical protein
VPLLAGTALLLGGALNRQAPPPGAPGPAGEPAAPQADPAATDLLERAVARLRPERVPWVEAGIWQQVACEDFTYRAEGRYLAGPGRRLRLNLHVRLGRSRGELLAVSDGTTLWQSSTVDGGSRLLVRVELARVLESLSGSAVGAVVREEFFQQQLVAGLAPLLHGLGARMVATRQEPLTWNGRDVVRVTLLCSPEAARALAPAGGPWPASVPRKCVVYLDAATLWPHRLEWWGPARPGEADTPVVQMEFRDPVLNRPLSEEECLREFSFDPGPDPVPDQTGEVTASVRARAQQLSAQTTAAAR